MRASELLKIAAAEIGYLEKKSTKDLDSKNANAGSGNFTKYWRDLRMEGYQGQPWCDAFVKWCFEKATKDTDTAKAQLCQRGKEWSFYTPTSANYYKQAGRFYAVPEVGDQIFFKDASGTICHTGIVESISGTSVTTIEGNTSGYSGVEANGGAVCRKNYVRSYQRIAGYGRPLYDEGKWKKDLKGWWYQRDDGTYPTDAWLLDKGRWYWFKTDGYAARNEWLQQGKTWYWFLDSCAAAQSECAKVKGKWYAFDSECHMYTKSIKINANGDLAL